VNAASTRLACPADSVLASATAEQQPQWADHPSHARVCETLASADPLTAYADVWVLRGEIAAAAAGGALLLQAGDCAESLYECTAAWTLGKLAMLDHLGDQLSELTGCPVLRVGRIGGQFAKPRSEPTEQHAGVALPSFRGHLVNSEVPTAAARQPDPRRMLWGYEASKKVLSWIAAYRRRADREYRALGPWASHEALVIDYESNLVRVGHGTGDMYLASTHMPWIGVRTSYPGGAHARLLASVRNPVGCKVGPATTPDRLLELCAALDPHREPGRLVLIARLGRQHVEKVLPPLVKTVTKAGYPVLWLSDPMHGNTVRTPSGWKTRHLDDVIYEAVAFRRILRALGVHPGGLHLEVTTGAVTECVDDRAVSADDVPRRYSSLCDPRLNPGQAQTLLDRWTTQLGPQPHRL
jgi:3-deoxy-7-phosphoheptulonate synthase